MGLFRFYFLVYSICYSSAIRRVSGKQRIAHFTINSRPFRSRIDKFVDKLFQETDANNDKTISFDEMYVGCLLLYVQLNRQAPIPPPSREKAFVLFLQADKDKSNVLNREQYGMILRKIARRAFLRLSTHKVVTWVGAPLLTEVIVRSLVSRKEGFERVLRFVVPSNYQEKIIPILTSQAFHRALWMVILVAMLGNVCLGCVNFLLDLSLPNS